MAWSDEATVVDEGTTYHLLNRSTSEDEHPLRGSSIRPMVTSPHHIIHEDGAADYHDRGDEVAGLVTFEDCQALDAKRHVVLKQSRLSIRQILFSWTGTVIPNVLRSSMLWTCIIIYLAVYVPGRALRLNITEIDDTTVDLAGLFISFFLVFYNNHSISQFYLQYRESMAIEGFMANICTLAKANIECDEVVHEIWRLINAIHIVGYSARSSTYSNTNFVLPLWRHHQLITEGEYHYLAQQHIVNGHWQSSCYKELVVWLCRVIKDAEKAGLLDMFEKQRLQGDVLQVRARMAKLFDFDDQPLPYIYTHLITTSTCAYLLLQGYNLAAKDVQLEQYPVGFLFLLLFCLQCIGLLKNAKYLENPYGPDLNSLRVLSFCTSTTNSTGMVVNANFSKKSSYEGQ